MNRLLNCNCGKANTVSEVAAGQNISCSHCGELVSVPGLRELRLLPAEQLASDAPNSDTDFSLAKICFLGGLMIAGVGAIMAVTYGIIFVVAAFLGLILCAGGWIAASKN